MENRKRYLSHVRSIVVKLGTQLLSDKDKRLDSAFLAEMARQVVGLRQRGTLAPKMGKYRQETPPRVGTSPAPVASRLLLSSQPADAALYFFALFSCRRPPADVRFICKMGLRVAYGRGRGFPQMCEVGAAPEFP